MDKIRKTLHAFMITMMLLLLTPMAVYAMGGSCVLTVKQVFTASSGAADAVFNYMLRPLESGSPMPAGTEGLAYAFTITGNAGVDIGPISYSTPGEYRYELFQVIGAERSGYEYDGRVYTIEVYVDEALGVDVVVLNENGEKEGEITFQNAYGPLPTDPTLMVDPQIRKTVFGNPGRSVMFSFKLEASDPSSPMPPGSVNGVKTITVTGSGMNEFGNWGYDKAGTYYYTVSEVNTDERGYAYDTALYTVTDMVKEENGRLTLNRVVTNEANKPVMSYIFNNVYRPGGINLPGPTAQPAAIQSPLPVETQTPPPDQKVTGNPPDPAANDPPAVVYTQGTDDPPAANDPPAAADPPDADDSAYLLNGNIPESVDPVESGPRTGDETNMAFYAALFCSGFLAAAGAAIFLISGKRRGRDG